MGAQGGAANCPSPRGEPRGVHINVVAVPVSAQGNFRLYPANIGPPIAGLLNYKAGVQNIANAGTFKTFFSVGVREIEIQNRVGTAHLVIDVMGYYHEVNDVPGVDWSSIYGIVWIPSTSSLSPTLLRSQTIDCPGVGTQYVVATGSANISLYSGGGSASDVPGVLTSLSTSNSYDFATEGKFGVRQNVTSSPNTRVGYGTISKTHVFTCTGGSSLTVRLFAFRTTTSGDQTRANRVSLVLTVFPKKY